MKIGLNMLGAAPGSHTATVYMAAVARVLNSHEGVAQVTVFAPLSFRDQLDGLPHTPAEDGRTVAAECKNLALDAVVSLATHPIPRCPVPQALLTFDLRPWLEPSAGSSWFARSRPQADPTVLQRAASVIATSEFLHKQLLQALQVPLDRVQVARPGVMQPLRVEQPRFLTGPYLLAVGTTSTTRNLLGLRELINKLAAELPHFIVVAGAVGDAEPTDWGSRVLRIEHAGWDRLGALYQHADLFLHAATYDGCGLAVLEAMAAGAPIACGRVGALPEIAGNVPYYFNAESVDSMVGVIRRALTEDAEARKKRIQSGRKGSAEFTWEATAWKVLHALKRLA